jgi:hypothetical protein
MAAGRSSAADEVVILPPPTSRLLPRLKVSANHHFLVYENGPPFFYLGDTAWEIFHRLKREEVDHYLSVRAKQGFTVIQAVAIGEFDGHTAPNAYGFLPLTDLDPARPATKEGPNNDYWDHVDYVVERANNAGLYVGLLPTWGRYWHDKVHNDKPLFNRENAAQYGRWLGQRYKDRGVIWILGGDRNIDNDEQKEIIHAMALGLRQGDGGNHLITFHPSGGQGSAKWFQKDDWMDFNLRQNGHTIEYTGRYDQTRADYDRTPPKPVIDGEPIYEDHPVAFNAKNLGHSIAADVRRAAYWDLFSGACGHTYGNHAVWQMWQADRPPINNPLMPWTAALNQPGAKQMIFARQLLESRPILSRIPDDGLIVDAEVKTEIPGAGTRRFVATRDSHGTYGMVYVPVGRTFQVHLDKLKGARFVAWWYNPRDGHATICDEFAADKAKEFTPPTPGEALDWVLVIDDAAQKYPPPGTLLP